MSHSVSSLIMFAYLQSGPLYSRPGWLDAVDACMSMCLQWKGLHDRTSSEQHRWWRQQYPQPAQQTITWLAFSSSFCLLFFFFLCSFDFLVNIFNARILIIVNAPVPKLNIACTPPTPHKYKLNIHLYSTSTSTKNEYIQCSYIRLPLALCYFI